MNNSKKFRFTLGAKILIITLLIVVLSNAFLSMFSARVSSNNMTRGVTGQLIEVSNNLTNQIYNINAKEFAILHSLAALDLMKDEDVSLEEKQTQLSSVLKELKGNYENIAFYDSNGDAIVANGKKINFATRAYFTEAYAGKDYASDPTFSTVTNSVLQHYSVPVYNNSGKIIGAIVLVINGNALDDKVQITNLAAGAKPMVINRKTKKIIAGNTETDEKLILSLERGPAIKKLLAGETNVEDYMDPVVFKNHVISFYQPVPDSDWSVFATAPYDAYFGGLKKSK